MVGGGIGNAVVGTFVMVGVALVLSTPLGVLSAIYVNEYAPASRLSNAVRFVAKLLTGIPSIICGVFAYAVVVLTTGGFSAWAAASRSRSSTLPTIILTAEQALLGVSKAYREASYGLGATNYQTIWRIVLPDALPAIMTGVMLAVARAPRARPRRSSSRRSSASIGSSRSRSPPPPSRCSSTTSPLFPSPTKFKWPGQPRSCS